MELKFRPLRADEIDVRVQSVNQGGVVLLLYKDARCDQNILDETVGPLNWERSHTRENANCVVSIWDSDKDQWVSKEDTGTESNTEKEKGLASDSFKRACFNWGIGRELYTAPQLFVPAQKLKTYSYNKEAKKGTCFDEFTVTGITYTTGEHPAIDSVTIGIGQYGKVNDSMTFRNSVQAAPTAPGMTSEPTKPASKPAAADAPTAPAKLSDDTVILIGNCRGKKFGDAKTTEAFKSFLKWVKTAAPSYDDAAKNAQLRAFKSMAEKEA